jgi:hypothetical protein|tara:strand:+ start:1111 stop:1812 length:702 start_codon:yes stop_codon:yes gene_type:complete
MPRKKAETVEEVNTNVTPNDLGWTDHVLELLSDDEKIKGNPTTDGLRRVFEIALNCTVIKSESTVEQTPDLNNANRGTVSHSLTYVLNDSEVDPAIKTKTVNGAADVYWGNCDKIFRNHPIAVAETRAEGRALRRALKLRKVVAAEELADEIEDDIDGNTVGKMSSNQINFIDVLAKRLNIDVLKLTDKLDFSYDTIYNIKHGEAVSLIQELNAYQQDTDSVPEGITGYKEWK